MGLLGPSIDSSFLTFSEYDGLPSFTLDDGSGDRLSDALESGLREASPDGLVQPNDWWLGHPVPTESGVIEVVVREPAPAYGVLDDGRLLMDEGFGEVTVAQFVRALDEGYYDSARHEVTLVPPPEVGGNGFLDGTIVEWLVRHAPDVIFAYVGTRVADTSLALKSRRLEQLAAAWAAQRIDSPYQLRMWIDRKGEWFPQSLGDRLSLPAEAAERLLTALGYEKNENGLMLRRSTPRALELRDTWMLGEHGDFLGQFDEEEGWENAFTDDSEARPATVAKLRAVLRFIRNRGRK